MTTAPYGSWESPLTAQMIAAGSRTIHRARFLGDAVVHSARSSADEGRIGLFINRSGVFGDEHPLLSADWNVRSRVHEYGGGAWEIDPCDASIVFVEASDQRLHRFDPAVPHSTPRPLTSPTDGRTRYGDLVRSGDRILAVREDHAPDGAIVRSIVEITGSHVRRLSSGPHFLAWPRLSPSGDLLAFIGWDHPDMPWDATRLYIQRLTDGRPDGEPIAIFGRSEESILQPEWLSSRTLAVSTDRSGRWQLRRLDVLTFLARAAGLPGSPPGEESTLLDTQGEVGGPLWTLGARWHLPVHGGNRMLVGSRWGASALLWADVRTGESRDLDCGLTSFSIEDCRDGSVLLIGGSAERVTGLYAFSLSSGDLQPLALADTALTDPALGGLRWAPRAHEREFDGIHAIVYPPSNPDVSAPAGELPPYIAFVHGGPTGQAVPMVSAHHAYFTSRGIGVVEVNYGGSTGYGRAYRNRVRGEWGIVDVEDTVTVLRGLVEEGAADPHRLAISGASAGGWTVLRALTTTTMFACGVSRFGIADLSRFSEETHDFESHYIESLVGPADDVQLYAERSPLNHLDALAVPVAILQGELDPIVPPSQARRLIAGLERAGLPYAAALYPEESHGFVRSQTISDALETELAFYGRVMRFATPGIPAVRMQGRGR